GEAIGREAAEGIELVTAAWAGASPPPLVLFRIAKKPNTRIATTAIPRRVRRLGVSQGTAKRCRIIEPPSPRRRAFRLGDERDGIFQYPVPTIFLKFAGSPRGPTRTR